VIDPSAIYYLTVLNRLSIAASAQDRADWTLWCGQCTEALRQRWPGAVIPLDDYLLGRAPASVGLYYTTNADDLTDRAAGLIPRSLRDGSGSGTHFNAAGYREVAAFVARPIGRVLGIAPGVRRPMGFDSSRGYYAAGAKQIVAGGTISGWHNVFSSTDPLLPNTVGPVVVGEGRSRRMRFSTTQALTSTFASAVASPCSVALVMRLRAVPAGRADIFYGASSGDRPILRTQDYSGTIRWNLYANFGTAATGADTGFVADTNWHTMVAVFDGAASYLYVDGVASAALNPGTATCAGINLNNPAFAAAVEIAEVYFAAQALSSAFASSYHSACQVAYPELLG
jgi:hypothetical protein